MKDEIKEILEYIDDRVIPNEKWNVVKDYITNLQQENERLDNNNIDMINQLGKVISIIYKAIEFINDVLIPYGDEWHWDDSSIRDYVELLLNILQNEEIIKDYKKKEKVKMVKSLVLKGKISEIIDILKKLRDEYCDE